METDPLIRQLHREILFARRRIYTVGDPTPLERVEMEGAPWQLFVKREDRSPIHAYKWRGACNRMATLTEAERTAGVVTASAGNHAQGVALAAAALPTHATIFMPVSTPRMKQEAVRRIGGDHVSIQLVGDSYDEASQAAHALAEEKALTFIHAYDDLEVMGGQGTLADEIVLSGEVGFDIAYLQVGGGGMAAAVGAWLKMHFPTIEIVGVEGVDQASMAAAIQAGHPVTLDTVDVFCDGTAVRRAGDLTFQICRKVVDRWTTVTNEEVSAGIQFLWEHLRCIPEPSGAMGVAAALQEAETLAGKRVLTILCGANVDFEQLHEISKKAALGAHRRRFLRVKIREQRGEMRKLLKSLPADLSLIDIQYGQNSASEAHPILGLDAPRPVFDKLIEALTAAGHDCEALETLEDVNFRVIHFEPGMLRHPLFFIIEFHERPGALSDLLAALSDSASIVYFNYSYSGERVGRALLGFDFAKAGEHPTFIERLEQAGSAYRRYSRLSDAAFERILN